MRYMDLGSILRRAASNHPSRPMLHWRDTTWTFARVFDQASAFAEELSAREVVPGERVVLCLRNRPEYVVALFGCALAGAVPVPTNYRFSAADIRHVLADTGARFGVIDEATAGYRLVDDPAGHWIVAGDALTPSGGRWSRFDRFHGSTGGGRLPELIDDDEPGAVHYTSGSTAKPKGVVRSHGSNAAIALGSLERLPMRRGDVWGLLLPMHSAGIYGVLLAAVMAGNPVVVADYDADSVGHLVERHRVTHLAMGPTMYYGAARSLAAADTRSVRYAVWGGMPPNNRATRALEPVLPVPVLGAFGMTEATSISYSTPEIYASGRIASSGYPISSMAFTVIGPDGEPLGPGQPGELLVRGAAGFTEYLNQPRLTAEVLRDGWIHTGDRGWLDGDGALTVTGRLSGMIISGNENISPEEIETVIAEMPGVEQVAVVGRPSDRWGQEVCAFVVADHRATPSGVQEYCRGHLARYKVPKRVFLIDDLPKDPQGKVQKKLLVGRDRS